MRRLMLTALLGMAFTAPLPAETLLVDAVPPATTAPPNGATMEAVRARLGSPQRRLDPVGEPAITRWQYPEVTVYFEGERVIHTVARPLHRDP
ncbi:hypothetical protein [Arhodomonas sp. SL1]|uniref:hypothetical protein n=1 Tax=Arhodomonas sp. SL1 TaxID=3425691 RepID=UPI003F8844A0